MAKTVFDKINDYLAKLPDTIEKGVAAVVIREVDKYALEFFKRVQQETKYQRLKGVIELKLFIRRGRYGYRLVFDGYDENNTPLQMIANVLNTGRVAGSGVAESGRRYAYGKIEGIQFMSRNLELLSNINREISSKTQIEKWVVVDGYLALNDGTRLSIADLDNYEKMSKNETE